MAAHRAAKEFEDGLAQLRQALLVNNLEYTTLLGLPLVITVAYQTLASLVRYLWKKQAEQIDLFAACMFLSYLGLNALGQTRGEVGRIWLFLAPAVCLVGAYGMSRTYRPGRTAIYLVVGLQLVTAVMIFQFQDYGCKLCP
jgi:hypothetical protein